MSLAGEIAAALALAVLDLGANVIATDPDGTMLVARGSERVRLTIEVQPIDTG